MSNYCCIGDISQLFETVEFADVFWHRSMLLNFVCSLEPACSLLSPFRNICSSS